MKRTANEIQELFANHLKGNMFSLEHDFIIESTEPIQIRIAYHNQDQLKLRYTNQNYWVGVFEITKNNNLYFGCSESIASVLHNIIKDMNNDFRHMN